MSDDAPAGDERKPWAYVPPTDEEKRRLAAALIGNSVFTSLHVPEHDGRMLGSIFMPLMFGAFAGVPEAELERVNPVLYEYLDKAGPRSVNGYPIFFSMHVIAWDEWREVIERVTAAQAVLGGAP
jgi:hypothetical protein